MLPCRFLIPRNPPSSGSVLDRVFLFSISSSRGNGQKVACYPSLCLRQPLPRPFSGRAGVPRFPFFTGKYPSPNNGEFGMYSGRPDIRAALFDAFGARAGKLLDSGNVVIVQSEQDVGGELEPIQSEEGAVQAFFDPASNKVYLVADDLSVADVKQVMSHEAFHWLERNQPEAVNRSMRQLSVMLDASLANGKGVVHAWFAQAKSAVPDGTPVNQIVSEIAAYAVSNREQAPATIRKWAEDMVAGFRTALIRMGWTPSQITDADLAAMARYAVRKMSNSETFADKFIDLAGRLRKEDSVASSRGKFSPTNSNARYNRDQARDLIERVGSVVPAAERLSAAQLLDVAENVVSQLGHKPPFTILESLSDYTGRADDAGGASGMVFGGKIYLFRDAIAGSAEAVRTVWHELLHYGIRRFLSADQYIQHMRALANRDAFIRKNATLWAKSAESEKCWACGCRKPRARSSGCRSSPNSEIVACRTSSSPASTG